MALIFAIGATGKDAMKHDHFMTPADAVAFRLFQIGRAGVSSMPPDRPHGPSACDPREAVSACLRAAVTARICAA
jgi:hypothetical protein